MKENATVRNGAGDGTCGGAGTGTGTGSATGTEDRTGDGLVVRELHGLDECRDIHRLFHDIWHFEPDLSPLSVELILALAHSGNYVAGAYQGSRLVGASVAFLAAPPGQALHSHITGVRGGRGIGLALKLHQRTWALRHGLTRITWTFDPLVRRNAYFNLVKLGATLASYHQDFYGPLPDSRNGTDDSDRAVVHWRLDIPATPEHHPESTLPALPVLTMADDGHPLPLPSRLTAGARFVRIDLPPDIEGLRRTDPAAATAWRLAVRDALGRLLDAGARVTGFHGRSGYLLDRRPPATGTSARPAHTLESPNR
ncbi:GNAT family N-acetyltransferase [Streptomyces sp. NPDC059477]|uniref:GNAT family N-acetyltransferase n=1 Tax=Streptomyces sp. NPDC059477 TaxID=3346847 RepID=UPI0036AB3923